MGATGHTTIDADGRWRRFAAVVVWAVAFALVEAMVVFYIRRLFALQYGVRFSSQYTPAGFHFPSGYMKYEKAREAATMVMLLAAAYLAGRTWPQRLACYLAAFGVWDIFYYFWLYVLLRWPQSLADRDLLFLLPSEWWGPVWEPVLASVFFIAIAVWIFARWDCAAAAVAEPRAAAIDASPGAAPPRGSA
jgi:hypothetical protein